MKGLTNKKGKLIKFVDGKIVEASETDPALFPDNSTVEKIQAIYSKAGIKIDLSGLQLVDLDVKIDKPQPKYSVAKI